MTDREKIRLIQDTIFMVGLAIVSSLAAVAGTLMALAKNGVVQIF